MLVNSILKFGTVLLKLLNENINFNYETGVLKQLQVRIMSKISTLYNKVEEICYNKNTINTLFNNKLDTNIENIEVIFNKENGDLIFSNISLFNITFNKDNGDLIIKQN